MDWPIQISVTVSGMWIWSWIRKWRTPSSSGPESSVRSAATWMPRASWKSRPLCWFQMQAERLPDRLRHISMHWMRISNFGFPWNYIWNAWLSVALNASMKLDVCSVTKDWIPGTILNLLWWSFIRPILIIMEWWTWQKIFTAMWRRKCSAPQRLSITASKWISESLLRGWQWQKL